MDYTDPDNMVRSRKGLSLFWPGLSEPLELDKRCSGCRAMEGNVEDCTKCGGRGYELTPAGQVLIEFVLTHLEDERELFKEWLEEQTEGGNE